MGGIAGHVTVGNEVISTVNITNCYHVGKIEGIAEKSGSIIGLGEIRAKGGEIHIKNCYVLHDDCSSTANGDLTEKDVLVYSNSIFRMIAEDISPEFITNEDKTFNNGYPIFKWQNRSEEYVVGDANLDNKVSVADAVAILQFIGNKDKYNLSEQGKKNADVDGAAGITAKDALILQQVDAGLLKLEELPLK